MSDPASRQLTILGFMTGTSLDAIDLAVIETDGENVLALREADEVKFDSETRAAMERAIADALAWSGAGPEPRSFRDARSAAARAHVAAAGIFFRKHPSLAQQLDLIAVHGQTVLHRAPLEAGEVGRSIQLIDAQHVADALGTPVAHDFRSADMAAGGQGAPLAPAYHEALVRMSGLPVPVAVLNLGGVANITSIGSGGSLNAFDAGPSNGMIDELMQSRTGERMDRDGALALAGTAHRDLVAAYLSDPFFSRPGAKSLDRFHFSLRPVSELSLEDAAATLTAFAAEAIGLGLRTLPETPRAVIVAGGGRRNPALMRSIRDATDISIVTAEDVGWRGDSLEAEAFAFLAARSALGLPISFPSTTGVARPLSGGSIALPSGPRDGAIPFDVVAFDLDGTLVDTAPDLTAALNHCLRRLGREPAADEEVRHLVGHGAQALLRAGLAARGGGSEELVEASLPSFLDHYAANICAGSRPYPGIERALHRMAAAGARLAICTNKSEHLARLLVRALGWEGLFASVVGGDTFPVRKPDPMPLLGAVERAGGGRALFVGDSIVDADSARAARLPFVAVDFGYSDRPAQELGADAVIGDYDELIPALRRIGARAG